MLTTIKSQQLTDNSISTKSSSEGPKRSIKNILRKGVKKENEAYPKTHRGGLTVPYLSFDLNLFMSKLLKKGVKIASCSIYLSRFKNSSMTETSLVAMYIRICQL